MNRALGYFFFALSMFVGALPPPKPMIRTVYVRPLIQWHCDDQERSDYLGACAHRRWANAVFKAKP